MYSNFSMVKFPESLIVNMLKENPGLFAWLQASRHIWWQTPKLHIEEDEEEERKTSWLELFFDLIFVAVIAQLSHRLAIDVSWQGIAGYVFLFIPVWWAWNAATFYNERFEVNDVRHRVFTFLKMIPVAGMAYAVHDAFGTTAAIFAWSYILFRLILIYLWLSAGKASDPMTYAVTKRFSLGLFLAAVCWLFGLLAPMPARIAFWGLGIIVDLGTPLTTLHLQAQMPKISTSHLPERFGLFALMAMAESVIGVVTGASKVSHLNLMTGVVASLGLFLSFMVWWVYSDHITMRPYRQNVWSILAWCYLHLPLVIGITAIGAGIVHIVAAESSQLAPAASWLMCGAVAFVLFIMALIGLTAETHSHQEGVKLTFHENLNRHYFIFKSAAVVLMLGVGLIGKYLGPILVLLLLAAIMASQGMHSLYEWVKSQMEGQA